MKIALVEDDHLQCTLIKRWLEDAGHQCRCYPDGDALRSALPQAEHQLLLLDWELPGHSGLDILEWLRSEAGKALPVIFLTQRQQEEDIVRALRSGADDYVIKPAREQELLARIEALARRSLPSQEESAPITIGQFTLHENNRLLQINGKTIELTHKEFALASLLLRNIGTLLTRENLMTEVWGYSSPINTRTVDTHISRVRKKLSLVPEQGWQLSAVYQCGYRLDRLPSA